MNDHEFESHIALIMDLAYRVALNLTRNGEDAMDLVQEASIAAYRGCHTFECGTNFKAWYLRILTNLFFSSKRKGAIQTVDVNDAPELVLYLQCEKLELGSTGADPVDELFKKLDSERIMEALAKLPDDYRAATTLCLLDDLSYQDISDMLDVPVGTVRSRIHRGRNLLQRHLWNLAVEHNLVEGANS